MTYLSSEKRMKHRTMWKKSIIKCIRLIGITLLLFVVIRLLSPTWTPSIKGENSISELVKVNINEADLQVMIRGNDRSNPVLIFVHGGPCCSEIPYARKYQEDLEKDFTIVHYRLPFGIRML